MNRVYKFVTFRTGGFGTEQSIKRIENEKRRRRVGIKKNKTN